MANEGTIRRKQRLLATELKRYFGQTCPELTAKWNLAIIGLQPSLLRELTGRLQNFERITNLVNRELKAAYGSAAAKGESAESVLDRALASLERLTEVADDLNRRVDELLSKKLNGTEGEG
jgi:hypothetical protein